MLTWHMPKQTFTKKEEAAIKAVGAKIEDARRAMRLSVRSAAARTNTSRGHMTDATWRRVERGFIQTRLGDLVYRPSPETLVAIAEVVGLDGNALCKELGMTAPPAVVSNDRLGDIKDIRTELTRLVDRLAEIEASLQR